MGAACSLRRKGPLVIDVAPVPGQGSQLPAADQDVAVRTNLSDSGPTSQQPASPGPTAAGAACTEPDTTGGPPAPTPGHAAPRVQKEVTVGGDSTPGGELKPRDWLAEVGKGDSPVSASETTPEGQAAPTPPAPTQKQKTFRRRRLSMTRSVDPASADAAGAASAAAQEAPATKQSTFRRRRL